MAARVVCNYRSAQSDQWSGDRGEKRRTSISATWTPERRRISSAKISAAVQEALRDTGFYIRVDAEIVAALALRPVPSWEMIAQRAGVCTKTVRNRYRALGLPPKPSANKGAKYCSGIKWDADMDAVIWDAIGTSASYKKLADRIGIDVNTLKRRGIALGVEKVVGVWTKKKAPPCWAPSGGE